MPNLTISLSRQAIELLDHLTRWGVYGQTPEEVGARFIDQQLADLAQKRHFKLIAKETLETESNGHSPGQSQVETKRAAQVGR